MDLPGVNEGNQDIQVKELTQRDSLVDRVGSEIHFFGFTEEKKKLFISNAFRFWPNKTRLCASVGIDPSSYWKHTKLHPDFAMLMDEIDRAVTDDIEMVLRFQAGQPKSFLDRMAYLRAHRPELYDRAKVVKIEGYKMGDQERSKRMSVVDTVIDAEIAQTYLSRKEKQQRKAQQRLESGEGGAGSPRSGAV